MSEIEERIKKTNKEGLEEMQSRKERTGEKILTQIEEMKKRKAGVNV